MSSPALTTLGFALPLVLPGLLFLLLAVFAVRVVAFGLPRTERVRRAGGVVLGNFLLEFGYWMLQFVVGALVALGLSANGVTWLTLPFALAAGIAFGAGSFGLGAPLLLISAALDSLDGQVARRLGSASDAGELWDAIADRYTEGFAFAGIAFYYRERPAILLLLLACWSGAFLVSYARAKADAAGVDCGGGPMQRHERAALLVIGTAIAPILQRLQGGARSGHPLYVSLVAVIAFMTPLVHYTAARRALLGWRAVRARERAIRTKEVGRNPTESSPESAR